jgi:hypothetical protein
VIRLGHSEEAAAAAVEAPTSLNSTGGVFVQGAAANG